MFRAVFVVFAWLLLSAQTIPPGFPPGTFQSRAAIDASGALPGPPTFTYQGNFGTVGNAQTQTTNALTIGGTGPQLVLLGITNLGAAALNGLTSITISTGGTCLPYAEAQGGTNAYSGFIACVTSGTSSATVTWTYASNPFVGSQVQVYTALTSGLVSTAPTGGNGVTATANSATTVTTAASLNAAAGGVCFTAASNSVATVTTADFSTGATFTTTTEIVNAANSNAFAGGDTIAGGANPVVTTSTAVGKVTWGAAGNLSYSEVCFR